MYILYFLCGPSKILIGDPYFRTCSLVMKEGVYLRASKRDLSSENLIEKVRSYTFKQTIFSTRIHTSAPLMTLFK